MSSDCETHCMLFCRSSLGGNVLQDDLFWCTLYLPRSWKYSHALSMFSRNCLATHFVSFVCCCCWTKQNSLSVFCTSLSKERKYVQLGSLFNAWTKRISFYYFGVIVKDNVKTFRINFIWNCPLLTVRSLNFFVQVYTLLWIYIFDYFKDKVIFNNVWTMILI